MKRLVLTLINRLGRRVLAKHRPVVIAVTGSAGKTTTKEAITAAVSEQRRTRSAAGSLNTQWGVFLSIVGYEKRSGAYSRLTASELLGAVLRGLRLLSAKEYAEVLVLEMGADRPGDIGYLMGYYPPDVAVVTNVGMSHLAQFSSVEAIAQEKGELVRGLKKGGTAVLNADDLHVRAMGARAPGAVVWYGVERGDVRAGRIESTPEGVSYTLTIGEYSRRVGLRVRGGAGVFASLAAISVAHALELDLERSIMALEELEPPPMRLNVSRFHELTIIDDSYNASPASMKLALAELGTFPGRKVAILGEMRELGEASAEAHREIGAAAAKAADRVLVVGEEARPMAAGRVGYFDTVEELIAALPGEIRAGDAVLVKASRGVYLERVVEKLSQKAFREKIGKQP